MRKLFNNLMISNENWTLLSVVFIYSLFQLEENSWLIYITLLAQYFLLASPLIVLQALSKQSFGANKRLKLLNFLGYIVFPVLVVLFDILKFKSLTLSNTTFVLCLLLTQLSFVAHKVFKRKKGVESVSFLSQINLDKWLILVLAVISLYFGLLIASDLPLWLSSNSVADINVNEIIRHPWLVMSMAIQFFLLLLIGFMFYWLNKNILVVKVLKNQGLITYLIIMLGAVCALYPALIQLHLWLPINRMATPIIPAVEADPFSWQNGQVFLAVMLISLPFVLVTEWNKNLHLMAKVRKEHTQTELQLLKQQIDPHFFLNTLNNLYALTRKKSDMAPEVVLQLSEIMRYVVYRGQEAQVSLSEEIVYLKDYMALQRLRYRNDVDLNIDLDLENTNILIPPLLFIILVENAFKHGVEKSLQNRYVHISLFAENSALFFTCKNNLEEPSINLEGINFGLGLNNLSRRLQLLYPGRHSLDLNAGKKQFTAALKIELQGV